MYVIVVSSQNKSIEFLLNSLIRAIPETTSVSRIECFKIFIIL